jgi:hypothetical protein
MSAYEGHLWPTHMPEGGEEGRSSSWWSDHRKRMWERYVIVYDLRVPETPFAGALCNWRTALSDPQCRVRPTTCFAFSPQSDGLGPLQILLACDGHAEMVRRAFRYAPLMVWIPKEM